MPFSVLKRKCGCSSFDSAWSLARASERFQLGCPPLTVSAAVRALNDGVRYDNKHEPFERVPECRLPAQDIRRVQPRVCAQCT